MGHRSRRGFTLVELLVVIAIIGTLVGLLLPAVQVARESARRSSCGNNIKQLALGCLSFADARGSFPAATSWATGHIDYANNPTLAISAADTWSFIAKALPFIEQQSYFDSEFSYFKNYMPANVGTSGNWNNVPMKGYRIATLECPSDKMSTIAQRFFAPTSYRASAGDVIYAVSGWPTSTSWYYPLTRGRTANGVNKLSKISDGMSKTLLIGEAIIGDYSDDPRRSFAVAGATYNNVQKPSMCLAAAPSLQSWTDASRYPGGRWADNSPGSTWFFTVQQPNSPRCSYVDTASYGNGYVVTPASSYHSGGAQVAMCDGSVRFMSDSIDNNNLPDYTGSGSAGYPSAKEKSRYGVLGAMGTPSQEETFDSNGVD